MLGLCLSARIRDGRSNEHHIKGIRLRLTNVTCQSTLYFFILISRDRLQTGVEQLSTSFFKHCHHLKPYFKKDKLQNFNTQRTLEKKKKKKNKLHKTDTTWRHKKHYIIPYGHAADTRGKTNRKRTRRTMS